MNICELKDQADDVRREIEREREQVRERDEWLGGYLRVLNATVGQLSKIGDLNEELELKQAEIDDLTERLEQRDQVIAALQQQLLEKENQQLESRNQSLEAEVSAKPTEIHNHCESGSSAQVFNDKVTGRFARKQNVKRDKKEKKKRWKKIARKIL